MTEETRNSETKPDGRFKPGNPGKPRGVRHRATALAEKLLSKDIEKVVEAVQAAAEAGDMVACKLILDRLAPAPKGRLVSFALPPIQTAADGEAAIGAVLAAVATARISAEEADKIVSIIKSKVETQHMRLVEERLGALEQAQPRAIASYKRVS